MSPWLVVEVDQVRGLAAVRGGLAGPLETRRVARLLSPTPPVWSAAARGWVIPATHAEDVRTYGWTRREWVLVYDRKAG